MNNLTKTAVSLLFMIVAIGGGVGTIAYGVGRSVGYKEAVRDMFDTVSDNNAATLRVTRACHKMMDRCYEIEHKNDKEQ